MVVFEKYMRKYGCKDKLTESEHKLLMLRRISQTTQVEYDLSEWLNIINDYPKNIQNNLIEYLRENSNELWKFIRSIKIKWINEMSFNYFGVESLEEFREKFHTFHNEDSLEALLHIINAVMQKKTHDQFSMPALRTDGRKLFLLTNMCVLPEDVDTYSSVFFSGMDISEQKEYEKQLAHSEKRFRNLYLNLPFPTFTFEHQDNGSFILVDYNREAVNVSGNIYKLIGINAENLYTHQPHVLEHIKECYTQKTHIIRQYPYYSLTRERMFELEVTCGYVEPNTVMLLGRNMTGEVYAERVKENYRKQLRQLASELTLAEEHERKRIAQLLHDGVCQNLLACRMKLESSDSIPRDEIKDTLAILEETFNATRSLTMQISPPQLYELGLCAAVEWLCETILADNNISATFKIHGTEPEMSEQLRIVLFLVIRELLWNIIKHASARKVDISFSFSDDDVIVDIYDDGIGIEVPTEETATAKGFGLFSIRERISYLGGSVEIRPGENKGTHAHVQAPLVYTEEVQE